MPTPMLPEIATASWRCSELIHRVQISNGIVSSALEVPRVSSALEDVTRAHHLSDESEIRALMKEYNIIVPNDPAKAVDSEKVVSMMAEGLAKQTATNAEMVISAAAVILSHSTADDVFTEACKVAIDLDNEKWIPRLQLDSKVSLKLVRDKGVTGVFADELERYKARLAGKSLLNRAKLLFGQVAIAFHPDIPSTDLRYFKMSKLSEVDDLRKEIVHRNGLPKTDPTSGAKYAGFLHEAANTAIRSVMTAYRIPLDVDYWRSLFPSET